MIAWFVLGLCMLAAAGLLARWFLSADPATLAKVVRWGAVCVVGVIGVFLALRLPILLPALLVAAPLLRRLRRRRYGVQAGPTVGQSSQVATDYLEMTLDHDSGVIRGRVLRGRYAGQDLDALSVEELLFVLGECRRHDPQSVSLLETYLDRAHGVEWREHVDAEGAAAGGDQPMSREEAYQVLGLEPDAPAEDIKEAHHRLLLKIHPDQGGSTYLAAKINQAKELLLGG